MKITRKSVQGVVLTLLESGARKATVYLDEETVVTATRVAKPRKREKYVEVRLKLGFPNFRERLFIKSCKKAGEPFPVKRVQLKFWPK